MLHVINQCYVSFLQFQEHIKAKFERRKRLKAVTDSFKVHSVYCRILYKNLDKIVSILIV